MRGFTIRVRGGSAALREFRCPEHGVFESRAPGDEQPCPWMLASSDWSAFPGTEEPCGLPSPRTFTAAPLGRVKLGEVTRGKVQDAPSPLAMDTQPLADGMPMSEWKERRRKIWRDQRRAEWKRKMG